MFPINLSIPNATLDWDDLKGWGNFFAWPTGTLAINAYPDLTLYIRRSTTFTESIVVNAYENDDKYIRMAKTLKPKV